MELKNLFNLSSESLEKLDLALANLPAEAKVASSEANWNDCLQRVLYSQLTQQILPVNMDGMNTDT